MISLAVFGLTFWLGAYLLARRSGQLALRLAGAGLLAYALAIALDAFGAMAASVAVVGVSELLWLIVVIREWRRQRAAANNRRPTRLLFVAAVFFALSAGALLLPLNIVPRPMLLVAIGFDIALLGLAIARLDAFDEGELLWRDLRRSLTAALVAACVFGGLIVLASGVNALTYLTITAAIASQVFADRVQTLFDRLAFADRPALSDAREELREVATALPRLPDTFNTAAMDAEDLVKLTRRALSNLGDLPKLSASPLTHLPAVTLRLEPSRPDTPLARASALQMLLTERIEQLKPAGKSGFDAGDASRHYNALYFPYVLGVKPYSSRVDHGHLRDDARAALEWFRVSVPERTLHNWQNAAAKLIAGELGAGSG
jgi:hypothetical protein